MKVKSRRVASMLKAEGRIGWLKKKINEYELEVKRLENEYLAMLSTLTGGQTGELRRAREEMSPAAPGEE